jgi:hypothetical protein
MRQLLRLILLAAAIMSPARASEPAESIQAVIAAQIAAFQANDLNAAFAHASPTIQSQFGTPEAFGQMVRTGYPVIWRPGGYQMLVLADVEVGLIQTVSFRHQQGRLFEAAYKMQLIEGVWRIDGVFLRVLPGLGS